jgi:NTE family protein
VTDDYAEDPDSGQARASRSDVGHGNDGPEDDGAVDDQLSNAELAHEGPTTPKMGLVLAGGAARGAYEVGVLEYIAEEVSKTLGRDAPLDILCGTSVGAINVCCLAAWADEPRARCARLAAVWTNLRIADVLRPTTTGLVDIFRSLYGGGVRIDTSAVFDPTPLANLLQGTIPFERIDTHLRSGRIDAVTASATQIATGRTVVFIQRAKAHPAPFAITSAVVPRPVRLRPVHTLASSALPFLFPPVRIEGRYYCDGGLRQNIPLSPARRLGATQMIVVNPKHRRGADAATRPSVEREEGYPSPLFLLGKTLNALLLDRIDNEIDRLDKINEILDAGTRRYGPDFAADMSAELGYPPGRGLRKLSTVHIHASENIGQLSAEHVRSPTFAVPGVLGRVMKRLAEGEAARESDLLSYLLFDGDFAAKLVDLGRQDAKAHHDALCTLFEEHLTTRT